MQIELNSEASEVIKKLREESKERGLKKATWDEIISELLCDQKRSVWESLIESHTSDRYFIETALSSPEARENLVRFLKKSKARSSKTKNPLHNNLA